MSPHTLGRHPEPLGPNKNAPKRLLFHWRRLFREHLQSSSHEISWHDTARSESRYYMTTDGRLGKHDPRDSRDPENGAQTSPWAAVPEAFRSAGRPLPPPWEELFGPLRQGVVDELMVVGQCGQSIDARIATPTGHSHYINGEAGLAHLHRLRALVDAVVVGVGSQCRDTRAQAPARERNSVSCPQTQPDHAVGMWRRSRGDCDPVQLPRAQVFWRPLPCPK